MKTPLASIVMFLIASLLGAVGQYLYKSGAELAGKTVLIIGASFGNSECLAETMAEISLFDRSYKYDQSDQLNRFIRRREKGLYFET